MMFCFFLGIFGKVLKQMVASRIAYEAGPLSCPRLRQLTWRFMVLVNQLWTVLIGIKV